MNLPFCPMSCWRSRIVLGNLSRPWRRPLRKQRENSFGSEPHSEKSGLLFVSDC
jgi:hypothetical protein